ncbi:MAG: GNAT family N-acetyltransferase [Congregibacter sp.]|nr:GNAT family N-acetyltransferase [Congregibacter sp.]
MSPGIRTATEEDLDAILSIDRAFSPVFAQPASYEKLLGPSGIILLATLETAVCGFAACSRVLDEATLLNLVVVPAQRSGGVASGLLAALCERLSAAGVARVLLEVREGNLKAQRLYLAAGFKRDGQRKNYYAGQKGAAAETAVLMSLQLTRQQEIPNAGA